MWKSYHTKEIEEIYLFKFLPKDRLIEFLKTGGIWFSRADMFGDKMECVTIENLLVRCPNYNEIEERKKKFLISCWHLASKESLAFWDTYSEQPENRKNFAVRFKRGDLVNLFHSYFNANDAFFYKTKWIHGKVVYKNLVNSTTNNLSKSRIKYPAFRKEAAFKYENEYRFVIELCNSYDENGFNYYLGEPRQLQFDILINPLLKNDTFNPLTKEIAALGFENNIQPSVLTKWLQPNTW